MKTVTKTALTATALALFGLAPGVGSACEYDASTSASATPPSQLALAPAPAATKVPAPKALLAPAPKTAKQDSGKTRESTPDVKVVAVSTR
jgi:hypothetical protein